MQDFFKKLFGYNRKGNDLVLTALLQSRKNEELTKLFSHILNAHSIWISRIKKETPVSGVWEPVNIGEMEKLNERNHEQTLSVLGNLELSTRIDYTTFAGKPYSNSIQDILFHVINHSTHHRGQIIRELRNQGHEPPVTDYIFLTREKEL